MYSSNYYSIIEKNCLKESVFTAKQATQLSKENHNPLPEDLVLRFILKLIKEEASRKTDKYRTNHIYIDCSKIKTSKNILFSVFQKLKEMDYIVKTPVNRSEIITEICWDID